MTYALNIPFIKADNMPEAVAQLSVANFRPGAYIIIENKKDHNYFFIIRKGNVQVKKSVATLTNEGAKTLGPGDFFGVIGAMTNQARIETAIGVSDVSLIAVAKSQFGFLIQKNSPLALKIIRSFSHELRYLNKELTNRSAKSTDENEEGPALLFNNAEYYYKQGDQTTAAYLYTRYLQYCPNGDKVTEAKAKIQNLKNAGATPPQPQTEMNRTYQDGQMIFSEHEPGDELFIIQSGKVKITKIINGKEILIAVLNPGDIVGEMALLENKPRTASIVAYGNTNLLAVNKENFDKIVIQNTNMATKLITLLSQRIWTIYKQLSNLLLKNPASRLMDTLLTQILKQNIQISKKRPYKFNFGGDELLKMVGLEGSEGKQALNEMLNKKFLQIQNNKIYCEDIAELQKEVTIAYNMQQREMKLAASKRSRSF